MSMNPHSLETVPRHIAFIMDGNGRWAQERGLSRIEGHKEGALSLCAILRTAAQTGIEYITAYAFSTENWRRPYSEIEELMKLLIGALNTYEQELHNHKIRLRIMGRLERLSSAVRIRLQRTMDATARYTDRTFIIALNYGSRTEIADASRSIAEKIAAGSLQTDQIDERMLAEHLYLPDVPDPELMIRTGGEFRLSNFLLWQLSYSEVYISNLYWPDFREEQFFHALKAFSRRERRYGGLKKL